MTPPSPRALWPEIPLPLDDLLVAMLDKTAAKRPSPAEVRTIIRELRGTPPPFEWDTLVAGRRAARRAGGARAARRSTLDVAPLAVAARAPRARPRSSPAP